MAESAWKFVYGSNGGSGVPDVYRASFRRMMTRTAIVGGAVIAASMHAATFLVNALPRGVLGSLTAFFWQIVTMVPLTAVYVLVGVVLGIATNHLLMLITTVLNDRGRTLVDVLCAAIGLVIFVVPVVVFAMPMLRLEADPRYLRVTEVLAPLVSAIGGALFGLDRARRVSEYLADRTEK